MSANFLSLAATLAPAPAAAVDSTPKYTLAELRNRPAGLDQKKLESYLSDIQFKAAFKVDKSAFYKLPPWKQDELKKKLGLH